MEQYVNFLLSHWILSSLFLLFLIALIATEVLRQNMGTNHLSPEQVVQMINHQGAHVIDIRSEAAYKEGHILNAQHSSLEDLDKKISHLQKTAEKPIILVCDQGHQTGKMSEKLKQKNMSVFTLSGGIQAWKSAGLPLKKNKSDK